MKGMDVGWWIAFEIILCMTDVLIYHIFLSGTEKLRSRHVGRQIVAIIGGTAAIYLKQFMEMSLLENILISLLIMIVYGVIVAHMKYYQYVMFAALYLFMVLNIDVLVTIVMHWVLPGNLWSTLYNQTTNRFICGVLSKMVLILATLMAVRHRKEREEALSLMSMRLLFVAVIISFVCIYSILRFGESYALKLSDEQNFYICLNAMGLIAIDVLVYTVVRQLNHRLIEEKQLQMVQYQNQLLEKAVLENKEVEKEWRKNRHDFNNHLSCIDMLLQMENLPKARAYIEELTHSYAGSASGLKVGNEIADAVVNQKYVLAQKNHIKMKVEGTLGKCLHIEQMDLCAVLSNALDNAIEAAQKVEDEEKRFVNLAFKTYRTYLIIEVKNAVKENVVSKKESLPTTKDNKNRHGIGMTSMQTTVEKYKGYMEWHCKDHCFSLILLFPMQQEHLPLRRCKNA